MKRRFRLGLLQCPRVTSQMWRGIVCAVSACLCARTALASGTTAGTAISNTATATYTDPNNAGQTLNAVSNTVSVTVAEVAGVTASATSATDTNGHPLPLPGDVVNYDYTLTNVGNDPTQMTLPGSATITGPGTAGALQYKISGASSFSAVPTGGITTASLTPGQTVTVRVPVTVNAGAATGQTIAVLLGSTGANDNSAGTQNQPFSAAAGTLDVTTKDNADSSGVSGEIAGAPVTGEREASATQSTTIGAQPQAFALVHLTRTAFTPGVTASQDVLTYSMSLDVQTALPSGAPPSLVTADLVPSTITIGGSSVTDVLISDTIPVGTVLTGTPAVPSGWTVVYSTVTPTSQNANAVNWTTTAPTDLTTVKRIGFVTPSTIAKGSTVTGFTLQVLSTGARPTAATTVADIAQVFGQTSGDATNALVYDESGDAAPSNFNDNGSPGSSTPTDGVANSAADGTDASNNNTGTGAGGEDNVFVIQPDGAVINGPQSHPDAVGPTDNNDDFTNLSAPVPAGTAPGTTIDPDPVTFTNTLSNPSSTAIGAKISLLPQSPSVLPGGSANDLPNGTKVTITYSGTSEVFTYNSGAFTHTSGTQIQINGLAANGTLNYTVIVDLPASTALSTDTGKGYSVPIQAYVDTNVNGSLDSGEPTNRTVDRLYTGYLKMTKQARVIDVDGTTVLQPYTATPTSATIQPGRFIDYQITYTNISSAPIGSNNVTLNATGLTIDEDGTALPNNWARDNDSNGTIDTSHVSGTATDSGAGATITFFSGSPATTSATDASTSVTRYVDTLSAPVTPGETRTLTFRRRIN